MNINQILKTTKSVVTANSPVLLVGTAVVGVVATGVLAAKAGYKARGIIDDAQLEKDDYLTPQEKVRLTWLCYAPPVLTGVGTIAATVGLHTIHTKRFTALAGLYAVTAGKLDDYRNKAEEMLGAKKSQDVRNSVAQTQTDGKPVVNNEVVVTEQGTQLFYDDVCGRYYSSNILKINEAKAKVNLLLANEADASLNDFYETVGLEHTTSGRLLGWSGGLRQEISVHYGAANTPNGGSATTVWFQPEPKSIANGSR